jgi:tetratricopeptide (TPR) repeat protein
MRASRLCIALIVLLAIAHPPAVTRALADDADTCSRASAPVADRLAACTHEIESGLRQGADLANAYLGRGISHRAMGENDDALADYGEAIRLDPTQLGAYRAKAGDFDAAVKWQSRAIELLRDEKPKADYRTRLELYRAKKPYREASP